MEKFEELFNNDRLNSFIDRTYVTLSRIKTIEASEIEAIMDEANSFLNGFNINSADFPYVGLNGLPGSGKTTISTMIESKTDKQTVSTDVFLAKLRELHPEYPAASGTSDDFRKHEYKVVLCMCLSGLLKDRIVDHGGAVFLQPGIAQISKIILGENLINLRIDDTERVWNLTQDAIVLGETSFRTSIKNAIKDDPAMIEELKSDYIRFKKLHMDLKKVSDIMVQFIEGIGDRSKKDTILRIFNHCENFDKGNRWRLDRYEKAGRSTDFNTSVSNIGLGY